MPSAAVDTPRKGNAAPQSSYGARRSWVAFSIKCYRGSILGILDRSAGRIATKNTRGVHQNMGPTTTWTSIMLSNRLVEEDRAHFIHPVTPLRAHERRGVTVLESADGCFITDATGHRLLDGFAGLWCVNTGYGRESIVSAAMQQMRRLPYATGYFHFGSEPAIRLASKLAELAPGDLNHVFFTLGGSDAVDTAIRMVRYYNNALGRAEKKHFISLERGYHGSTSNGAGLTALPIFHDKFDLPRPWQHHIPRPIPIATRRVPIRRPSSPLASSRCGQRSLRSAPIARRRSSANACRDRAASSSRPADFSRRCRPPVGNSTFSSWSTKSSPALVARDRCLRLNTKA